MSTKPISQMLRLQQQNRKLQKAVDQYMQQIQHLKNMNEQHQKQIESLLKFNQRLLTIIQEEVNNNQSRINERSLQPISQVTEVDSEVMEQMMQSLQKTRNKLAARSEKGGGQYKSHFQGKNNFLQVGGNNTNNVYQYMNEIKDLERSERFVTTTQRQHSQFGNKSSFSKKRQKKANFQQQIQFDSKQQKIDHQLSIQQFQRDSTNDQPIIIKHSFAPQQEKKQSSQEYTKIEEDITKKLNWEIEEMRKNSEMNHHFLEQKIDQLNKLSKDITYNPEQKFNQIQGKIKLSPHLAAMVKKAMVKGK